MTPLLQLHPKRIFAVLGKVRRGSFNPFDLKEEISHFVRNDNKWRREKSSPRTLPEKIFFLMGEY
jgi:hypothetical protein